jgi:YVTN family beta-propeller protein
MKNVSRVAHFSVALGLTTAALAIHAQAPYKIAATTVVGEEGGFDYVTANSVDRQLYVARSGPAGHVSIFNLDTLAKLGEIADTSAHGATVDVKYGHGFTASKPVKMFDSKTFKVLKSIDVQGSPDGYLDDPFNSRVYVFSHVSPNVTVIDAKDGNILGTIDLGGAPEQAVTDEHGRIYIDLEDKGAIAVVDAKTMTLASKFDISSRGDGCAGLALDKVHSVLFAACREHSNMVILSAKDGKFITELPTGKGSDGAVFNEETMEAFSSQGDGTLSIIKEDSPTSFRVEQTVTTPVRAKTLTLDRKTGRIFLITAKYGDAPASTTGRPARPPMIPGSFSIITVSK